MIHFIMMRLSSDYKKTIFVFASELHLSTTWPSLSEEMIVDNDVYTWETRFCFFSSPRRCICLELAHYIWPDTDYFFSWWWICIESTCYIGLSSPQRYICLQLLCYILLGTDFLLLNTICLALKCYIWSGTHSFFTLLIYF